MQRVIVLGRTIRERHSKPLKTPLMELIAVHPDQSFLSDLEGTILATITYNIRSRA